MEQASVQFRGRTVGFAVMAKVAVLVCAVVATSFDLSDGARAVLGIFSIVYAARAASVRMALWLTASLALIAVLYLAFSRFGVRLILFSLMHVYQGWHAFPVMAATCVVCVSPPGTISAALSLMKCPKKIILGVLVILRFFPTFASMRRALRDSLRKRGLLAVRQVLGNPLDTYEYVMVPMLMALVNSADQLASSAVTRAAEAPTSRTSYYRASFAVSDAVCVLACMVVCAGVVTMGRIA